MLYSISAFIFFILIYFWFYIYKTKGERFLFNNPLIISSYFFALIHLVLPVMQWYEGFFRYGFYSEIIYIYSIIYTFFLFLTFSFIFCIDPLKLKYVSDGYHINGFYAKRFFIFIWFIFIVGFMCSATYLYQILSKGIDVFLSDRLAFSESGSALKVMIAHWVYIACILFFCGYVVSEFYKKYFLISFLLSLLYCLIYYGVNSNRNSIFLLGVTIFIIYYFMKGGYLNKKTNFKYFVIGGLSFVSFFYFVGKFRNSIKNYNVESYSFSTSLNGGFGNHENIVWLLNNNFDLLYGKTYLASILNLIPRSIWEGKPYGGGPELKNMIYPGSYVVGQEGNSSLTTGIFTEALMNFGILGSFVFVFFFSIFIYLLLAIIKSKNNFFYQILFIYLFVLVSSQLFYAEFLGFFIRTLFTCIPIILLAFFIKFERKF